MTVPETDHVVALGRLHAAYADVVTRRAWAQLLPLFAEDATIELELVTSPDRTIHGAVALGEMVGAALERFDHFTFVPLNHVVDISGDTATGRLHMCEIRHDRESDSWQNAFGVYHDRFVRLAGRWRFAHRHYRSLARTGPGGMVLGPPEKFGPPEGPGN
ncbi:MAG: nuclear transport factor 2 family protein [Microthrixaceae bacterium]